MGTHPIFESDFDCLTEWLCKDLLLKKTRSSKFRRRSDIALIMSALTKKKYVIAETLDDFDLEPGETIQMIVGSPGSQLFEVEDEFSQRALASLPNKFRKTIWLKRKDFVVCMPIFEGNKVKYEITRILQNDHLKKFGICAKFPSAFQKGAGDAPLRNTKQDDDEESDDEDSLPENTNRRFVEIETSSSEDEEEESDSNNSIPELE